MSLRGQASPSPEGRDAGYAMAALLVALAVMAVLMSVAMPVWRHDAQREKEEELVWRGQQYIRAIRLFQAKNRTFPTSVDMLVQGRYLRKKYKDPITDEDFLPIPAAGAIPGQGGQTVGGRAGAPGAGSRGGTAAGGRAGTSTMGGFGSGSSGIGSSSAFSSTTVPGGLLGVVSKSKDESIRLYQGRNRYNEWTFIFAGVQPGGPGGQGRGGPGGRGRASGPGGSPFGPSGVGSPFGSPTFGGPGAGRGRGRGTGTGTGTGRGQPIVIR